MCLTLYWAGGGCYVEQRIALVIITWTMTTLLFSGWKSKCIVKLPGGSSPSKPSKGAVWLFSDK